MANKPKTVQPSTPKIIQQRDLFLTPNYGTDTIIPFIPDSVKTIWECCAGEHERMAGRLFNKWANSSGIYDKLQHTGLANGLRDVIATDICTDLKYDVLEYLPENDGLKWDCAITNPPYSLKKQIVQRFISLNKPFAFLIPADFNQWILEAIRVHNCEIIVPDRRINYITPTGKQGKDSAAQFHSFWLTRYMNVDERLTVVSIPKESLGDI